MNKRFQSYQELVKEKQRLEVLLQAQKEVIYYDVEEIKADLQPLKDTVSFVTRIITRDKTSILLNIGSDILINSVVQRFILSKAGWFIRTVIPFFLRNYSSHFLAENKDKWIEKLKSWLSHKNGREHAKENESVTNDR